MTPIAPHITAYLREHLTVDRRVGHRTCDTYTDAFRFLFDFMSRNFGVAPSELYLEQIDTPVVLEFWTPGMA